MTHATTEHHRVLRTVLLMELNITKFFIFLTSTVCMWTMLLICLGLSVGLSLKILILSLIMSAGVNLGMITLLLTLSEQVEPINFYHQHGNHMADLDYHNTQHLYGKTTSQR